MGTEAGSTGEMEPDYEHESWADAWHEAQYPTKEEYPECFTWTCCDQPGDAEGCQVNRHIPSTVQTKRSRV
jgi:hypothetical protein